MANERTPSEFGGEPGLVQRGTDGVAVLDAAAEARLMRATDPADPNDSVDGALVREWRREGRP